MGVGEAKTIDHKKQAHHGTRTLPFAPDFSITSSLIHPLRRNGDHQGTLQALKVEHKLALATRLGALRETTVLLH